MVLKVWYFTNLYTNFGNAHWKDVLLLDIYYSITMLQCNPLLHSFDWCTMLMTGQMIAACHCFWCLKCALFINFVLFLLCMYFDCKHWIVQLSSFDSSCTRVLAIYQLIMYVKKLLRWDCMLLFLHANTWTNWDCGTRYNV